MRKFILFSIVRLLRTFRDTASKTETSYKLVFTPGFENTRWQIGKWKAWYLFEQAQKTTPAYKAFINEHPATVTLKGFDPDLTGIPVTDKESYVKKFSIEERCVDGKLPEYGAVIDESSGTSGTPNNWVRGPREREEIRKIIQLSMHNMVGKKQIFLINAFALGPWATGMNVSMSLVNISVLKSTGPDVQKIVNTLNLFGPNYQYIICGYPPFLKNLVDSKEVDWKKFKIISFYGGEGMSEPTRDYLLQYFERIYGSYGASDLEINIATENDYTIALRRTIVSNPELSKRLVKDYGMVPMIFQYNPLDYVIETNSEGELMVTLCRASNVSPKVRYNIHDLGHVLRMPELQRILQELNITDVILKKPETDLPLIFHYGRSDASVGFYGCKVTPNDIQEVVYGDEAIKDHIASFSLITFEDEANNKHLTIALELLEGHEAPGDSTRQEWETHVFDKLREVNQDFRESSKMVPEGCHPTLEIYKHLEGPFADQDIRVKRKYIINR
jgi:phenylacetate-CoA ligase